MQIIIYGKDNCTECNKSKLLCQMQSIRFQYLTLGQDISVEDLQAKVGQPVRSLPQTFIEREGSQAYVGGYDALRRALQSAAAMV
jgi:glutaredoxin 1